MRNAGSAGRQAHEVVGLYGDPDTTWGICLELGLAATPDPAEAADRLAALVAEHPHLGPAPRVEVVPATEWAERRERAAAAPYAAGGELVRVLLDGERRLLVAAHHGVCDGLGLLAIARAACGVEVVAHARGIGDRAAPRSFLRSSIGRLAEAVLRPPPRFGSHQVAPAKGEHLVISSLPRTGTGTADLALAVGAVFRAWSGDSRKHPLLVAGASRRATGMLAPDRQTAYLRFRLDPSWGRDAARAAFAAVLPEPEFPETSAGGIGPRVTRMLRSRLGGTAQISNLGVVEAAGLEYAAMFPALSGPRAFAVGLVSTGTATTVSLRTRATEFSASDTAALLDLLVAELAQ
ncbi:hypothetical protein EFK50_02835 [Nocardioides marmoriginsengisoli]|uniref:Condensation domain-containing protein n=1 Tax=Nocardioides marmoriginsengisoli TaxID=661483 RepID=A0A3N0CN85_9ACTN|nr:hypothetical protein [Nocardioides marmoriginsengisoli]RNL64934.1 hypothetical protein EFK50_02835 [Nocardioides marmoriginsengisoli]